MYKQLYLLFLIVSLLMLIRCVRPLVFPNRLNLANKSTQPRYYS